MEGVLDVYEEFFTKLVEPTIYYIKKSIHTCLICRQEHNTDGSYSKSDRFLTENIILEYLEHLQVYGYSKNLAKIFINSVRDSGILCRKVKGLWEFKEHPTEYIFIIEHSVEF